MKIQDVPFYCWLEPGKRTSGVTGRSIVENIWKGNIRVRMVEYTRLLGDHWCSRGHVLLVMEGELVAELDDGRKFVLKQGMSYQVAEDINPHRSYAEKGKLFIVD